MSPDQQNLLELAKQNNTRRIEALINRSLQPKGITAKVNLKGSCLQVLVESDEPPDQELIAQFLARGIKKLNIEFIDSIKVFGKQRGQDFPDWIQDILLRSGLKELEMNKPSSATKSPVLVEKSKIPNIRSTMQQDRSKLESVSPVSQDKSSESTLKKSKSVVFLVLRLIWKWYISGFKSRPDLPLWFSPRLYRILFTFFVFVWVATPFGLFYGEVSASSSNSSVKSSARKQDSKFLCSQDDEGNPKHIIQVDNTRFEITKLVTDYYKVLGVEDIRSGSDADFAYTIGLQDQINYYDGYPRLAPDVMDELEEVEAWFVAVSETCTNE